MEIKDVVIGLMAPETSSWELLIIYKENDLI
jgi:hypothetical protein